MGGGVIAGQSKTPAQIAAAPLWSLEECECSLSETFAHALETIATRTLAGGTMSRAFRDVVEVHRFCQELLEGNRTTHAALEPLYREGRWTADEIAKALGWERTGEEKVGADA